MLFGGAIDAMQKANKENLKLLRSRSQAKKDYSMYKVVRNNKPSDPNADPVKAQLTHMKIMHQKRMNTIKATIAISLIAMSLGIAVYLIMF